MPIRPRAIALGRVASVGAALALGAACDGPGNSGREPLEPNVVELVPWQNGVVPHVDTSAAPDPLTNALPVIFPSLPAYPPIALGAPDPGPGRTDCSTVGQYEFSKGWFDSFELTRKGADPNETGVAPGWATYDDLTKDSWHSPGDATWYPGLKGTFYTAWGLPAERTPGPSCDGTPNDWVLHFRGGLFRKWGAGISHAFMDPVGTYRGSPFEACADPNADFCPAPLPGDPTTTPFDSAGLPTRAR
jgi:hypothetical protein